MADNDSRAGARYANSEIIAWLDELHAPHDAGLARAFASPATAGMPAIQVGRSEGKLLELMLRLVSAERVVEVGTLAGYSTIRLARALGPGGKVWTFELDAHHAQVARDNVAAAGLADRVEVIVGAAADALAGIETHGPFCAVFIDADKESYDVYGRWAAKHVRTGGLLLGDNAYLFGHLLDDDARGAAMRRFHEEARTAFDTVCIPTPDGLLLGVKR